MKRRADGRWMLTVTIGYSPDGKRIRRSVYGRTQAECREKAREVEISVASGVAPPPAKLTVGDVLNRWLESRSPALAPGTRAGYESMLRQHLIPGLGRVKLGKLSREDVERFIEAQLASGLNPTTVANHRKTLRAALNWAMKDGLLLRNVAKLASGPRMDRREVQPLTRQEAMTFREAIQGDRLVALYMLCMTLGLRRGEALGLRWEDVDLRKGVLHVRHTLIRTNGEFELADPKTAKSRRDLALAPALVAALRSHQTRQRAERLRAGREWLGWDLVFCDDLGRPLWGSEVTKRFQRVLRRAGLRHQRFHDLRHAAASFMLLQGVQMKVVSDVLGHSNMAITANTYAHVAPELAAEAVARNAEMLWGAG